MELTLIKEDFGEYRAVWNGIAAKEFSTDCVIPDTMPDVGTVIDAEGTVLLRSRNTEEGRVVLEASVSAVVLYMPEGDAPIRSLPVTIPVEVEMDAPGVSALDESIRTVFRIRLRALDARMVNSRKITVRADVEAEVTCYNKTVVAVAYEAEAEANPIHLLGGTIPSVAVCDIREKIFVITDGYALPSGRGAERILSQRVEVFPEDGKYVSGKVVFRGRVLVSLLFGNDQGEPVCNSQYETEFSQILEAEGEGEIQPEVYIALTGVYFDMPDPADAHGKLSAEIHMVAQCVCRSIGEIRYISDAYSNSVHLLPVMECLDVCTQARAVTMRQTVAGKAEPAVGDGEVLSVTAAVGTVSRMENGIKTAVNVRVLIRDAEGQYVISRCRLGAEFTLDITEGDELGSVSVKVADVYFTAGSGGADVRVTLQLDGIVLRRKSITCVGRLEADEDDVRDYDSYPSITLVRASAEGDLWTLAKKHHSTVESIQMANEGKSEGLLLIPKTR